MERLTEKNSVRIRVIRVIRVQSFCREKFRVLFLFRDLFLFLIEFEVKMKHTIRIGIIGEFNPKFPPHAATNAAIHHAAKALSVAAEISWLATTLIDNENSETLLEQFDALRCAPGSPYKNMDGARRGIRFARERNWPFVGT